MDRPAGRKKIAVVERWPLVELRRCNTKPLWVEGGGKLPLRFFFGKTIKLV